MEINKSSIASLYYFQRLEVERGTDLDWLYYTEFLFCPRMKVINERLNIGQILIMVNKIVSAFYVESFLAAASAIFCDKLRTCSSTAACSLVTIMSAIFIFCLEKKTCPSTFFPSLYSLILIDSVKVALSLNDFC